MPDPAAYHLAIETSSRRGFVALGRGDDILGVSELPAKRRHNLDLVPTIDAICQQHGLGPADLAELYVSLGPGSFTGLRIAVATAKMLALTLGVKIVGVPTLDILCAQHPGKMVCLNIKRDTAWSAAPGTTSETGLPGETPAGTPPEIAPRTASARGAAAEAVPGAASEEISKGQSASDPTRGRPEGEPAVGYPPALRSLAEIAATGLPLVADTLENALPVEPDVRVLYQLGRAAAANNRYDDPLSLLPQYIREPEAVTLWDQRHPSE